VGLLLAAVSATPAGQAAASPRADFLDALGRFSLALDGRYGDEGPRLQSAVVTMADALVRWDEAIAGYARALEAKISGASRESAGRLYVALAGEYLDRGRTHEAIEMLQSARRVDASSAAAPLLEGLAYARILSDPVSAVEPLRAALAVSPQDPARMYLLARQLSRSGERDRAMPLRDALVALPSGTTARRGSQVTLFLTVGPVRETAGLEPFLPPAPYADGFAALQRGELDRAVALFQQVVATDPLVVLGPASEESPRSRAAAAFRDGRVEDAVKLLEGALPGAAAAGAEARRVLGMVHLAAGNPARAVETLRAAVQSAPRDERARLGLASALEAAGDSEAAVEVLRQALELFPGSGRAHLSLGRIHQREGRYAKAIDEFQAALACSPLLGRNTIYQAIGELRRSSQDFEGAIEALAERVDLVPNAADAHQTLGEVYALIGRDEEALAEFHVALMLAPRADTYTAIAQAHLRQSRYAQAADAALHALQLDSDHRQARYVYGTSLIRQGRTDEGAREMAIFQRLEDEDAARRARAFELGALRRGAAAATEAGDHARAVDLLEKALVYDPTTPASHLDLGLALLAAGRAAEAIDRLTTAAALGAPFDVYRHLADAYQALGQVEESRTARATYNERRRASIRSSQQR